MATYQVVFNPLTKLATVQLDGAAPPAGSTKKGTFTHPNADHVGAPESHVLFHHVRDTLYASKIWDFQSVRIAASDAIKAAFPVPGIEPA